MNIYDKILRRKEFESQPPVLFDIGASGFINPKWRKIAKYSVCVAFDADSREMEFAEKVSQGYKKLYVINRIVSVNNNIEQDFYLTKSPFCSSHLEPDIDGLKKWEFRNLFKIEEKIKLKTISLSAAIKELHIERIDWFKTDSQGTDLRLFESLDNDLIDKVLVAEFEPGIIDAYKNEDKLFSVMAFMNKFDFWMSDIKIMGNRRINYEEFIPRIYRKERKLINYLLKTSPGWAEVTYLNNLDGDSNFGKREYLLMYLFSIIEKQYGFACEIAERGFLRYKDPVFQELKKYVLTRIRLNYFSIPIKIFNNKVIKLNNYFISLVTGD